MRLLLISAVVVACTFSAIDVAVAEPVLPAASRFHDNAEFQSQFGGRLLWNELKCGACHSQPVGAGASTSASEKQAPNLAKVASRAKASHLEQFILRPHETKPGTTMPSLLAGVEGAETKAKALVHYLVSLSPEAPKQSYATFGGRIRGEQLFHSVGCVGCHDAKDKKWSTSVPLGDLPAKYTLPSLSAFLRNPHESRPSGRMPSMNLSAREAADIASYLLPDVPEKAGINYDYYEIDVDKLPDFEKLTPTKSGATTKINLDPAKRREKFAMRYQGVLEVAEAGEYRFFLGSDDGSRLLIDNKTVINADGVHPMTRKEAKIQLSAGRHAVTVEYFEKGGQEELEVRFAPPGGSPTPLANELTASAPQQPLEDLRFAIDAGLAKRGGELFASLGCANCHEVGKNVAGKLAKQKVASPDKGCLAETVKAGLPDYGFGAAQRKSLAQRVSKRQPARATDSPHQEMLFTMLQFNCVACHQRGELGGVEQERASFFQTTQQEMGVEGSIPPHLNGVGAKLTPAWLKNILAEGAKDRPYMLTRMPKFGTDNVGHLGDALAKADKLTPLEPIAQSRKEAKKAGHRMVGEKGFSCIKCHTFGRHKATGVQSIDMTVMTKRLQEDWFRQYVRNPQVYRPGTRMPSAWPLTGKSYLPDLLDGDSDKQIAAVWTFLKDGKAARTPAGLTTGSKELLPIDEAIIYRNFIQGAGSRAIGVGYPDGLHIAFDANDMRLALLWKGAFMNAQRHWTGRGQGYEPPAGEAVQELPPGVAIATLASADAAWPSQNAREMEGYKFRGYRLDEMQYPTFFYQIGEVQFSDKTAPHVTDVSTTLRRQIDVSGTPAKNTYLRLGTGKPGQAENQFELESGLKIIVLESASEPMARDAGELVIPLTKPQQIKIEYVW